MCLEEFLILNGHKKGNYLGGNLWKLGKAKERLGGIWLKKTVHKHEKDTMTPIKRVLIVTSMTIQI
jgi:hypothetical protein